jgi:hypothetical protein
MDKTVLNSAQASARLATPSAFTAKAFSFSFSARSTAVYAEALIQ